MREIKKKVRDFHEKFRLFKSTKIEKNKKIKENGKTEMKTRKSFGKTPKK